MTNEPDAEQETTTAPPPRVRHTTGLVIGLIVLAAAGGIALLIVGLVAFGRADDARAQVTRLDRERRSLELATEPGEERLATATGVLNARLIGLPLAALDRQGRLRYGRYPQQETVETVLWEASRTSQALGHPVPAVIAVHHAPVPPGGLISDGVVVIQASELRRFLRDLPREPGWNRARIVSAYRHARHVLRPA